MDVLCSHSRDVLTKVRTDWEPELPLKELWHRKSGFRRNAPIEEEKTNTHNQTMSASNSGNMQPIMNLKLNTKSDHYKTKLSTQKPFMLTSFTSQGRKFKEGAGGKNHWVCFCNQTLILISQHTSFPPPDFLYYYFPHAKITHLVHYSSNSPLCHWKGKRM